MQGLLTFPNKPNFNFNGGLIFIAMFQVADQENEQRRRLEQAALNSSRSNNKEAPVNKGNPKKQQVDKFRHFSIAYA